MKVADSAKLEKQLDQYIWSPVTATEMLEQAVSCEPMFGDKLLFVSLSLGKAVTFRVEDPRDFLNPNDTEKQRLITRNSLTESNMDVEVEDVKELKEKWQGKKTGKLLLMRAPSQLISDLERCVHQPEALPWLCRKLGLPLPISLQTAKFDPFNL